MIAACWNFASCEEHWHTDGCGCFTLPSALNMDKTVLKCLMGAGVMDKHADERWIMENPRRDSFCWKSSSAVRCAHRGQHHFTSLNGNIGFFEFLDCSDYFQWFRQWIHHPLGLFLNNNDSPQQDWASHFVLKPYNSRKHPPTLRTVCSSNFFKKRWILIR